ncbi:hypothetical protein HBB16_08145 [Pseudonocardia sp. MCCB 268]|nr:hypothetical protein [Pseudonocardia cytotoxica]
MDRTERTTFDRAVQNVPSRRRLGWTRLGGHGVPGPLLLGCGRRRQLARPGRLRSVERARPCQHAAWDGSPARSPAPTPMWPSSCWASGTRRWVRGSGRGGAPASSCPGQRTMLRTLDAVPTATHVVELPPPGRPVVPVRSTGSGRACPFRPLAEARVQEPELEAEVSDAQRRRVRRPASGARHARASRPPSGASSLRRSTPWSATSSAVRSGSFGAVHAAADRRLAHRSQDRGPADRGSDPSVPPPGMARGAATPAWTRRTVAARCHALAVEHARTGDLARAVRRPAHVGRHRVLRRARSPWLFRQVHTDIARLLDLPAESVADRLLGADRSLPPVDLDAGAAEFRHRLRTFLSGVGLPPARTLTLHRRSDTRSGPSPIRACSAWRGHPEHGGRGLRGASGGRRPDGGGRLRPEWRPSAALSSDVPRRRDHPVPAPRPNVTRSCRRSSVQGRLRFCRLQQAETGSSLGGS